MAVTKKQLQNLRPPKKGEVRNPKGRGSVPGSRTRLLRLLELIQQTENKITGEVEGFTVAEQMDMAIVKKAIDGDVAAYREIIDRLEGKALQIQELTGKDGRDLYPASVSLILPEGMDINLPSNTDGDV